MYMYMYVCRDLSPLNPLRDNNYCKGLHVDLHVSLLLPYLVQRHVLYVQYMYMYMYVHAHVHVCSLKQY